MAPDDDERGIDWLASQLGPDSDDTGADGSGDGDAAATVAAENPAAERADAAAPTPRFGRRARRVAESVEEPVVITPAAPPVAATPAGPAPWWTTPLPQPVETDAATAESTDPVAVVAAAGAEQESDLPVSEDPGDVETTGNPLTDTDTATDTDTEADAERDQPTALLPAAGAGTEPVSAAVTGPLAAGTAGEASPEPPSRHRSRRGAPGATQAALTWTAVGLLALIVLVGLFSLGQRLVASPVPVAAPTASAPPTPAPTPTPTPTPEILAAQPAGMHEWNTLFGGECVEPYASPWEEDFTVVDCAGAHTAQLVYRGNFGGDAATVFPGEAALAAQINLLCTAPGILDLNAAGAYPNLQMQGSYPITVEQWTAEPRNFYCFVSRASAEPLTGSIMGAGPGV